MTRALAILAACLAVAVVALGLLLARARDDAAARSARHATQIEQREAEVAEARAAVRAATSSAAAAAQALAAARSRLGAARVAARSRVYVERVREAQTLSETPSADGARASLEASGVETTETATLALTWAAMARWRRVAAEAETRAEVLSVEVDALRAEVGAVRATGAVNEAKLREDIAGFGLELAEAQAQLGARVSRTRRTASAVSVGALVGGVAAAGLGLALCPDARCREVLGLGGAGLAVAGGAGAVLSW